jgi:hypothetical protein
VGAVEVKHAGSVDSSSSKGRFVVRTTPPFDRERGRPLSVHGFRDRHEALACAHAIGKALGVPVSSTDRG